MSMVHEKLYGAQSLKAIRFDEYLGDLVRDLATLGFKGHERPKLELELEHTMLDIHWALPLGLIANELISNALKHAFDKVTRPRLMVALWASGTELSMQVADNGPGMDPHKAVASREHLGMQLVQGLVEQLHGKWEVDSHEGAAITVTFAPETGR
jgi:two-component sensor histidine kinase